VAYRVEFLKTADEELAELPKDSQRQIVKKIEGLKGNPRPAGVKQLQSPEKFLRLRVGDYRIIYVVERKHLVVLVVRIGNRREVYDDLKMLSRRVKIWRQTKA